MTRDELKQQDAKCHEEQNWSKWTKGMPKEEGLYVICQYEIKSEIQICLVRDGMVLLMGSEVDTESAKYCLFYPLAPMPDLPFVEE